MKEQDAVGLLGALAQVMRLRIFRALVGAGPEGLTPGELSAAIDAPASNLSFHLKELMFSGMVTQERIGRNLFYRPSIQKMNGLIDFLTAHCCQGTPCDATRSRTKGADACASQAVIAKARRVSKPRAKA